MVRSPTREGRAERRVGEHDHSQQIVLIAKVKGSTNGKPDFIIGSIGMSVEEPKAGGGNDSGEVVLDSLTQVSEHKNPASLGALAIHLVNMPIISSNLALSARRRFSLSR